MNDHLYQKRVRHLPDNRTGIVVSRPAPDDVVVSVAPDDAPQRIIAWYINNVQVVS